MRRARWTEVGVVLAGGLLATAARGADEVPAATPPGTGQQHVVQQDLVNSFRDGMRGHDSTVSGKTLAAGGVTVVALILVAVVISQRQERSEVEHGGWGSAGVPKGRRGNTAIVNNPQKLVKELMKEAGLTRAQVRQLESLNHRLAQDDRDVKHLATLLLCPSLIASARPEQIVRT